jgi:hypothetical protein
MWACFFDAYLHTKSGAAQEVVDSDFVFILTGYFQQLGVHELRMKVVKYVCILRVEMYTKC